MIPLAVQPTLTTVTKDISQFAQPSWASTKVDINPSIITSITIAPSIDDLSSPVSGSFEVTELKVNGIGKVGVVGKDKMKDLQIFAMSNGDLHILSNEQGRYNISVYTGEGKLVSSQQTELYSGMNYIDHAADFSKGLYMVRLTGDNSTVVKKFIVTK